MPPRHNTLPTSVITARRILFLLLVVLTTFTALAMITSAFQQDGITPQEIGLLVLYTLLILWVSTSFWTATLGFWCLLTGGDTRSISRLHPTRTAEDDPTPARTAVVMPVYNEVPSRVFAGLRATYQTLIETGRGDEFELFILSDTRDPELWMREEANWYRMCQDFSAHGKIFYRNREKNIARKSGNIEEFCRRWGGRYRYMIVLDADSLMAGETLVKMVDLMESHPRVALIQSPPIPVNHESLFARTLQFASSLYSDIFIAGANFWQLSSSNYWGHNAIIRMKPFVQHCGLPRLPGQEPFGGEILSHDFVEATLLREAGWEVWLGTDLKGSYEELPPTLIDYAKRDRRWCQGNMQHVRMVFAKGISGLSRMYFLMGIMSYLSSPLWLLFLILTGLEAYVKSRTMPVYFFGDILFPVWPESYTVEMTTVLLVTLSMLFLPKFWSLILLLFRRESRKGYGGFISATMSVVLESIFSMLSAPILMLYQSKFVISILLRSSVGWPSQNRDDYRLSFMEALAAHWEHTLAGIVAGWVSYQYVPDFFIWLIPVLAGLLLSIPLSMLSSSSKVGILTRRLGLFITPEEQQPPRVIRLLHENIARSQSEAQGDTDGLNAIANPGIAALHTALLPLRPLSKRHRYQLQALVYQLVEEGPDSIPPSEKRRLISNAETLSRLHILAWNRAQTPKTP
ncbi:MAG: glucans biosynthesis glucosyltransferase MdoH [Methylococcaceae bacterium]